MIDTEEVLLREMRAAQAARAVLDGPTGQYLLSRKAELHGALERACEHTEVLRLHADLLAVVRLESDLRSAVAGGRLAEATAELLASRN